jgi:hypothetical protein
LRKPMRGPEAGKRGGGKAEMLKTETLKGRILRWTPVFGGIGRIHDVFGLSRP